MRGFKEYDAVKMGSAAMIYIKQVARKAGILLGLLFDPEDGDDLFLRN
jgi:hypothetical protein